MTHFGADMTYLTCVMTHDVTDVCRADILTDLMVTELFLDFYVIIAARNPRGNP